MLILAMQHNPLCWSVLGWVADGDGVLTRQSVLGWVADGWVADGVLTRQFVSHFEVLP